MTPVYKLDKLIEETRRLAVEYRKSTGTTLPVSAELAKQDAIRILGLHLPEKPEAAVDAYLDSPLGERKVQIKGRVLFGRDKGSQRIGQLNLEGAWDSLLLVLMDENYEPVCIYELARERLLQVFDNPAALKKNARGSMSVKKFQALSTLLWQSEPGPSA